MSIWKEGKQREEKSTHVAVLILDKVLRVAVELVEEGASLMRRTVLEDALEDTASVRVRRETVDLVEAGVGDEVEVLGRDTLKSALQMREERRSAARESQGRGK